MVTILEKSEHNIDFHPMVDFVEASPLRQYTRRTRIAQSSVLPPVANEHASPLRDVSQGEACPTDSGFLADQDRATIAKSSILPYDSAPRVTSPAAVEGTQELELTRLKARVKLLEDRDGVAAEGSRDDAPIKGRNLDEGEAAVERASDDTEEMAIVLTSMDAATVLASGAAEVPTSSGSIPTAGPLAAEVPNGSGVVPTASPVFATATMVTPYRRRKGKEVMVEFETPKKQKVQEQIYAQVARELEEQLEKEDQRMSEQIARDAEVARIHVEEELQSMIDGLDKSNETVAKYLQEYQQFASELPLETRIEMISDLVRSNLGWKVKDFRGMTFEEVEAKFNSVWKQIEDFIPIDEVTEEAKSPDEVPKEKHQMHAPVEWKLYDMCGVHQVTSKDKEIFMLVEKDYPLRKGLAIVMTSYKLQGRIVGNKMHKAFSLPVIKFPLAEEVPTASEESSHCQKKKCHCNEDCTTGKSQGITVSQRFFFVFLVASLPPKVFRIAAHSSCAVLYLLNLNWCSSGRDSSKVNEYTIARDGPYSLLRGELYGFVDRVDVAPGCPMSKELGYGITNTWDELVGASEEIAPTTLQGVNQKVTDLSIVVEQETTNMYGTIKEAQDDQSQLRGRVNLLYRDRPVHRHLAVMIEREAGMAREA
nr:hypothetical protein [Tanacetum cinerariifolium]